MVQRALDFDGFAFEHVQIFAEDLDGERALEAGEGFIDGVFGGLRVVEDHAGEGCEFLAEIRNQVGFRVDGALLPGFIVVGAQADVEFVS